MLSGHHRSTHDISWTPSGYVRCRYVGATRPTARCGCRICCQMRGCTSYTAVCLLPIFSPHSCGPVSPLACTYARWQSFLYVSLLLASGHGSLSSFCIPPAFIVGTSSQLAILTGLPLQLVLCEVCCFPLASVDGGIVQVPAPWFPHGYVRQADFGHLMAWPGRMGRCLRE